MGDLIGLIVALGVFAGLMTLGLIVGGWNERRHLTQLAERETRQQIRNLTQVREFVEPVRDASVVRTHPPLMLTAEVTLASDYLKTFLAGLRKLIGGEIVGFGTLMERARREAVLRLIEQAEARGYNALCNVRLDAVDIGGTTGSKKGATMVSIVGTATAYVTHVSEGVATPPASQGG